MSLNELTGLPLEVGEDQDGGVVDDSLEPGAGLGQDLLHPGPGTGDTLRVGHVELGDDDQPAGVGADGLEVVSAPGEKIDFNVFPKIVVEHFKFGYGSRKQFWIQQQDKDALSMSIYSSLKSLSILSRYSLYLLKFSCS